MNRKPVDPSEGLKGREEKRRSSVIANMINAPVLELEQTPLTQDMSKLTISVIKKREIKNRRKQILLQPTVHDKAEEKCKKLDISMNEVINQLLVKWIEQDN